MACTYSIVIFFAQCIRRKFGEGFINPNRMPTRVKAGPSHSLAGDAGQEALRMGGQVQAPKPGRLDGFRLVGEFRQHVG